MPRLAKKASSGLKKKPTTLKGLPSRSVTEITPGLKASVLAREVNEFLHAPKLTKKEKQAQAQEKLLVRAKVSAQQATGKISKKGEKQRRRRQAQAEAFGERVAGLRDALPELEDVQRELETRAAKRGTRAPTVKTRERVIQHDKQVLQHNIATLSTTGDSPLARLAAMKQQLAKNLGKDEKNNDSVME
ncbi:uncharacterized protein SAPINGB_P003793 [Magnusiomyces paraingens]|uniref:Ribosome biogenesis protein SLX9 n=1 Tax=Magnusiomyces paraingens TaxID=2606893 RepID=A0A5E8BR90_9ASCO|nr:uncharacterized protein SAPINGB_P003793 [Saprochaete ingens]VVT53873.1 unnamed protein product [Saprochaete ingens]